MARYIDAEPMLREAIEERKFVFANEDARRNEIIVRTVYKDLAEFINNQPTADVVAVRHGRWKSEMRERCDWKGRKQNYYQPNSCSVCHEAVIERTPYCPYCGANMDGGGK